MENRLRSHRPRAERIHERQHTPEAEEHRVQRELARELKHGALQAPCEAIREREFRADVLVRHILHRRGVRGVDVLVVEQRASTVDPTGVAVEYNGLKLHGCGCGDGVESGSGRTGGRGGAGWKTGEREAAGSCTANGLSGRTVSDRNGTYPLK
jgi:hypothetical protein